MTEERDNIITLVDDDGNEVEFEYLDTVELNGNDYLVLSPLDKGSHNHDGHSCDCGCDAGADADADADEDGEFDTDMENDSDEEASEVIIFRIEHGDNDEDSFEYVDDDNEMEAVFEEFKLKMSDEYKFTDD